MQLLLHNWPCCKLTRSASRYSWPQNTIKFAIGIRSSKIIELIPLMRLADFSCLLFSLARKLKIEYFRATQWNKSSRSPHPLALPVSCVAIATSAALFSSLASIEKRIFSLRAVSVVYGGGGSELGWLWRRIWQQAETEISQAPFVLQFSRSGKLRNFLQSSSIKCAVSLPLFLSPSLELLLLLFISKSQ